MKTMATTEQDPGTGGKKLSKSDSEAQLEARNKSYNKVLDAYINWLAANFADDVAADELKIKWQKKSEWHEKEFGW